MKKQIIMLVALVLSLTVSAQEQQASAEQPAAPLFGYLNYDEVLSGMTDYALVKRNLGDLRIKYDAETKRSEEEFNKKFEEFLEGQRDFAPSILRKRQSEIQDMMDRNVAFKEESIRLLKQAEEDAMKPLHEKLAMAIQTVGAKLGLAFVLNTSSNTLPYIDPMRGVNITDAVKEVLEANQ